VRCSQGHAESEMGCYLSASAVFMSDEFEPPRLRLGDLWPDDNRKDSDRGSAPLVSAGKAPKPVSGKPHCSLCAGELVRSRVRFYERVLTVFTRTRPYRCLDCGARRWR
jgi:hypothetical protein